MDAQVHEVERCGQNGHQARTAHRFGTVFAPRPLWCEWTGSGWSCECRNEIGVRRWSTPSEGDRCGPPRAGDRAMVRSIVCARTATAQRRESTRSVDRPGHLEGQPGTVGSVVAMPAPAGGPRKPLGWGRRLGGLRVVVGAGGCRRQDDRTGRRCRHLVAVGRCRQPRPVDHGERSNRWAGRRLSNTRPAGSDPSLDARCHRSTNERSASSSDTFTVAADTFTVDVTVDVTGWSRSGQERSVNRHHGAQTLAGSPDGEPASRSGLLPAPPQTAGRRCTVSGGSGHRR